MLLSELADLDIAILGAGREGQAAWRCLRQQFPGKRITVYDERPEGDFEDTAFTEPLDRLVCGAFEPELLSSHDVLIRSPGISPYRDDLAGLDQSGVRFTSASSLWFAQHETARTICITGTKGKSTTAALVAHLLKENGFSVRLAGNIGRPLLDFMGDVADWWVIELSSYQLCDLQARPSISAILNLTDEHLDWHGGSSAYQKDKLRLAELSGGNPLVANQLDELLVQQLANHENSHWFGQQSGYHVSHNTLFRGDHRLDDIPRKSLPGPHNLMNLAAALTILEQAGVSFEGFPEKLSDALARFTSLPHRLQQLGTFDGVSYISDSLSTTPVATLAGLRATVVSKTASRTILLVGGMDRGLDWRPFMPQMKELAPYAVICLPDNGPGIAAVMKEAGLEPAGGIQCAAGLPNAMELVSQLARPGDTVLLSPGAPSFPHFRDYEDRGEQFAVLAENIERSRV